MPGGFKPGLLPEAVQLEIQARKASPVLSGVDQAAEAVHARRVEPGYIPEDVGDEQQMRVMRQTARPQMSTYELTGLQDIEDAEAVIDYATQYGLAATINAGEKFIPYSARPALEAIDEAAPHAIPAAAAVGSLAWLMSRGRAPGPKAFKQGGWIGGPNANTANTKAWDEAKQMWEEGVDRNTIYSYTMRAYGQGWFMDRGRWKFERPDINLAMRDALPASEMTRLERGQPVFTELQNYLDHPELFEAYPDMRRTEVAIRPRPVTDDPLHGEYLRAG